MYQDTSSPGGDVFVVDDDPSILKALSRLLKTRAIETRTYVSAEAFIASLSDQTVRPEGLILDLQMPGMNGLELQHHLNRSGIRIPTIVITAHREEDARELCVAAGSAAYLLKPIEDRVLLDAINHIRAKDVGATG